MKIGEIIKSFLFKLIFLPGKRKTKKIIADYIKKIRFIIISKDGFVIENNNNEIETEVIWDLVNDANYNDKNITLYFDKQKQIMIPLENHSNWYELIKKTPNGFTNYDYQKVTSFFEKLQGCFICGLIAVDETNECLVCGVEAWNIDTSKEYKTKNAYIKEMQLEYFEPYNNNDDKIEINNIPEFGFKSYDKWIQLIRKSDYKSKSL